MTHSQSAPNRKQNRGFTLIETVVVVSLTALISVLLGILLIYFYQTNSYTLEQTTAVQQARRGVENSMRDLREASYGSDGSYPISSAATSSITFYSNIDNDTAVERVTYKLLNGSFYRVIGKPTGNPLDYTNATLATSTISTSVVNNASTPIFHYYDSAGVALSSPINISKIASVKITVIVDVNVNRAPVAFTLTAGTTLRNLDNQL